MHWYYMKRGSVRTRSILSDEQLAMMARAGELGENDLLWSEETKNKWVRASSIEKLFKVDAPESLPEPAPLSEPEPIEEAAVPEKQRSQVKSAIAAIIIAILAVITVIVAGKVKKSLTPPPPPATPQVETNKWETVETDLASLIKSGHLDDAREMITGYIEDNGNDATSSLLKRRLDQHLKRAKLSSLSTAFMRGSATPAQIQALVALAVELDATKNLKSSLRSALKSAKQPALCRNILALAKQLKDTPLQLQAVEALARVLDLSTSEKDCIELVALYIDYDMQAKAVLLLQSFTAKNSESSVALLELAALLALQNKPDESLEALKLAVKAGGDDAKAAARRDPRFDSIKDTWSFKWNTR
jgi:hypothetical protein